MNRRILRSIYAVGVDDHRRRSSRIDFKSHGDVAERMARAGHRAAAQPGGALPLAARLKRIAVIGGYADSWRAVGWRLEPGAGRGRAVGVACRTAATGRSPR